MRGGRGGQGAGREVRRGGVRGSGKTRAGKFNKISSLSPWAAPTRRPGPLAVTMDTQHPAPRDVTAPSICGRTRASHGPGVVPPLRLSRSSVLSVISESEWPMSSRSSVHDRFSCAPVLPTVGNS